MKLFKDTTWKWWELKGLGLYTAAILTFVVTTWPEFVTWLNKWEYTNWTALVVAVVLAGYFSARYIKQVSKK